MNRPYYALAALVVVLAGSSLAVRPARCHSATAAAANSSRSLCGSSPRDLVVAAHLFAHFETGWDAGEEETNSQDEQGCDIVETSEYSDSCGYDPYCGERYDAEPAGEDVEEIAADSEDSADNSEYGCETSESEERIEEGFSDFERSAAPPVCGGEELHCPYFGGCGITQQRDAVIDESPIEDGEDECLQAYQRWLAEQQAQEQAAAKVEEEPVASPCEDWKTAPVATPDWISDYLNACMPSLEAQYAEAELQAARDAAAEYGPELPEATAEDVDQYGDYESLYGLDAYLIPKSEFAEEVVVNNGPVAWSLSRIFGKVFSMFGEVVPLVEDQADELYDAADGAWQQWNDSWSRLALIREDAEVMSPYGEYVDDFGYRADEHFPEVAPPLPVEAAKSREIIETLAGSLRAAGELLLKAADGLEAEAERVLSAEHPELWSR